MYCKPYFVSITIRRKIWVKFNIVNKNFLYLPKQILRKMVKKNNYNFLENKMFNIIIIHNIENFMISMHPRYEK